MTAAEIAALVVARAAALDALALLVGSGDGTDGHLDSECFADGVECAAVEVAKDVLRRAGRLPQEAQAKEGE